MIWFFIGCSDEDTDPDVNSPDNEEISSGFLPLKEGNYWKYNCIRNYGPTAATASKNEEYEVCIHVISKSSDGSYEVLVTKGPCSNELITITQNGNGDLISEEKILLCKSNQSIDPGDYKSILKHPNLSGESWIPTNKVNSTFIADELLVEYNGMETWASEVTGSTGVCEHNLTEKYSKNIGMTSTSYTKTAEITCWNSFLNDYQSGYSYSHWTYTLVDYGSKPYSENISDNSIWSIKDNLSSEIQLVGACSFSIDNDGYIGLEEGCSVRDDYSRDFFKYNSATNVWQSIASLPSEVDARNKSIAFSLNKKGYICGGKKYVLYGTKYFLNDLWEYNPQLDIWEQKEDFPRAGGINNGVGFSIGDFAYVGLGYAGVTAGNPYGEMNDFYRYNPSNNEWSLLANFPGEARQGAVGFSMDGKGYVGLGYSYSSENGFTYYNDFWEYNPSNDSWSKLQDFPGESRSDPIGFGKDGKCYVGMGLPNDLYIFNIRTNSWSSPIIQECMDSRSKAFSFMIDNRIFYGAGSSQTYITKNDFWEFLID